MLETIFLGAIPDALFLTLFVSFAREIKTKRCLLAFSLFLIELAAFMAAPFSIYFYLLFFPISFLALHAIYGADIIDLFLITTPSLILTVLGFICFYGIPSNILVASTVYRLLTLLVILAFKQYLPYLYKALRYLWNRGETPKPIKSLTIRTCAVISINALLILLNITLLVINTR